jgi:hypothetical protein
MGREVRMASAEADPAAPPWKPYHAGCRQDDNYIDLSEDSRVYQSLWYDGHQLTDFVLIQQVRRKSRWSDVVKVDCCHQEVHAHQRRHDDSETRKLLQQVTAPGDLRIGLDKATDLIFKHWTNNLRRWARGR